MTIHFRGGTTKATVVRAEPDGWIKFDNTKHWLHDRRSGWSWWLDRVWPSILALVASSIAVALSANQRLFLFVAVACLALGITPMIVDWLWRPVRLTGTCGQRWLAPPKSRPDCHPTAIAVVASGVIAVAIALILDR